MTIAFLSDTHGKHREMKNMPQADMLIHAGDLSWNGTEEEIADFISWLGSLDYRHKFLSPAITTIAWTVRKSKVCLKIATTCATAA